MQIYTADWKKHERKAISMQNLTLFAQFVNELIDKNAFSRVVAKRDSDKGCKGFDTWSQFIWMLFCQLGGCRSIRDIAHVMESITGNLNHLGMSKAPSKSTVAYQNLHRDWHVFRDIYYLLWKSLGQQLGGWSQLPRIDRKIKLLDSSTITLSLKSFPWARYTHEKGAVKLHTLLDLEYDAPSYICVSDGKMADCKGALRIPVRNDMVIVADRGYMDFELLKHWDSKGAQFVVRHTKSIQYTSIQEWELPPDTAQNILKDEIIFMSGEESKVYTKELRRVVAYNEEYGYAVELLTNNFICAAEEIAALYKDRWYIETFFRDIKQLLKVKSFVGTSPNAVLIQVWTAMCAILLIKYLKAKSRYKWHLSNLVIFLRMNLFVKIDLWYWLNYPFEREKPPDDKLKQGVLFAI